MARMKPLLIRLPEELIMGMYEAAAKLGYPRGHNDKGGALFARQAIAEKINSVLGKRPTLPVLIPKKDKH